MKVLFLLCMTTLFMCGASCTGALGAQGPSGPQGQQGFRGELGLQGEQGASGQRGSLGQQGVQGIQGMAGQPGALPSEAELLKLIEEVKTERTLGTNTDPTVQVAKANNVLFFVVDDLGWGDVGYHGSKISTPTIDNIVAGGIELNRVYTFPVCELTRAGLLTGRSPLTIGVKNEHFYGTTGGLSLDEHLISQDFKAANYSTFMLGKWHLGGSVDTEFLPQNRGFDHFMV